MTFWSEEYIVVAQSRILDWKGHENQLHATPEPSRTILHLIQYYFITRKIELINNLLIE